VVDTFFWQNKSAWNRKLILERWNSPLNQEHLEHALLDRKDYDIDSNFHAFLRIRLAGRAALPLRSLPRHPS
jgi:hypothetical protein